MWLIFLVLTFIAQDGFANQPPVFTDFMNHLVLSEATKVGTLVYILKGYDPEGSAVRFGIQGSDKFHVDPISGEVRLFKKLDHEVNDTLELLVTIEDEVDLGPVAETNNLHGAGNNIVRVPVVIIIIDENDNPPKFHNAPYEVIIPEDTPVNAIIFRNLKVTDPDQVGEPLEVFCSNTSHPTESCNVFSIKSVNFSEEFYEGNVVLNAPLDYGARQVYQMILIATDGVQDTTSVLEIKIRDVQNMAPVFTTSLVGVVPEDASIGTLVMTVQARDGDLEQPREIRYELVTNPMDYFILDSESGQLRTARPLDKEALTESTGVVEFKIRAYEFENGVKLVGNNVETVSVATVTIQDANDEPPTFNQREYTVEIPENLPLGSPLPRLDMTVADPDVGLNAIFRLKLKDLSGLFEVEPDGNVTGNTAVTIRLANGSLDYENPNHRKFIVLVVAEEVITPNKLSSTATVLVSVTDVNDNRPRFEPAEVSASINEAASEGEFVIALNALDDDTGRFGPDSIVYKLNGNGSDRFLLNDKTGAITVAPCSTPGVAPCLDYEMKNEYHLTITATDNDGTGLSSQASLRITLTDANDNPPRLQRNQYTTSINEGETKFSPPLYVKATDSDVSSLIEYYIIGGNNGEGGWFVIDPHSGEIAINGSRLSGGGKVELLVQATDGKYSDTATVLITINDINNNAPIFEQLIYEITVPENVSIGTSIFQIKANDADSGDNAVVRYAVHSGTFDDFKLNNLNGVLMVSSKLDYDRKNNYSIIVLAMDSGVPSLTGTATIHAQIINSNDKAPKFTPATIRAEILESAPVPTVVHKLEVSDPDAEPGALSFEILHPIDARDSKGQIVKDPQIKEWFKIDSKTGEVFVANSLSRDIAALFTIQVQVTDMSAPVSQQGKGTLFITIIDVNDHAPVFAPPWSIQSPRYFLTLPEGWSEHVLETFTATDPDSSIDRYIIDPSSEWFSVDGHTGGIRLKKALDYEREPAIQFTLWAIDTGVPSLSSSAIITVTVVNLNDHDPIFSQANYKAKVAENSPMGTLVTTVTAHDQDGGDFGMVSYALVGAHANDFTINESSGEIRVQNPDVLDREQRRSIFLEVIAQDHGELDNRRIVTTTVEIEILDMNDNTPKFSNPPYYASVMENLSINPPATILKVHADDPDLAENGTVLYSIIKGNIEGAFRIDFESGIIYPATSLRGKPRLYSLTIQAKDGGGRTATVGVDITVQDVNEHRPVFVMPKEPNASIVFSESKAVPDFYVMTVLAKDEDSGDNGHVTYHFKVNNTDVQETDEFAIHKDSGEIRIRTQLDREHQSRYSLILVAKDHGKLVSYEAVLVLTVVLEDENDNQPEFKDTKFEFSIMENNNVGAIIGEIRAFDKDEGQHARIYYSILSGNEEGAVWLDRATGILYANITLDREIQDLYTLQIKASNDVDVSNYFMNPIRRDVERDPTMTLVKIRVLDENDNPPLFRKNQYHVGVRSSNIINELVLQVSAEDPDLGDNGTLDYFIQASNLYKAGSLQTSGSVIPSPFNITKEGKILVSALMTDYTQDRFQLTIVARERGIPFRTAQAVVYVWVIEPDQSLRVVLSRPPGEVNREKDILLTELSKATGTLVIMDNMRYHIDAEGRMHLDWTDLFLHAADHDTQEIVDTHDVLKAVDAQYDALKDSYAGFAVENILPAVEEAPGEPFDAALAALVALLVVLFVGSITFFVVCCCLRDWILTTLPSRHDLKKKDALIKQAMIEESHTTENPLWVEQKLKIYEEQELTMQVFMDSDLRNSEDNGSQVEENPYATIQHNSRGTNQDEGGGGGGDYETLTGRRPSHIFNPSSGFQGSTFQVPQNLPDLL